MDPPTVKLLQYNVLYANDSTQATPWKQRAAALREWIAHLDPDVVTMQEVTQGNRADNGQAVDMLSDILCESELSHSVFGPASDEVMAEVDPNQQGVVLGNAIASRWPISEYECRQLPQCIEPGVSKASASKRSAIWARIQSPRGPISVTCTHLNAVAHHGANRVDQMAAVLELVQSRQQTAVGAVGVMPSILCGDMNAIDQTDEIRYACGHHVHNGKSAPLALHDAWPSINYSTPPQQGHTSKSTAPIHSHDELNAQTVRMMLQTLLNTNMCTILCLSACPACLRCLPACRRVCVSFGPCSVPQRLHGRRDRG